jgi:hypothetical protein
MESEPPRADTASPAARILSAAIKATAVGNVITAFLNGVRVAQATNGTYASGKPGMGVFLQGATGLNRDHGLSSFSASEIR